MSGPLPSVRAERALRWSVRASFHGAHVVVARLFTMGRRIRRTRLVWGLTLRSAWYRAHLDCVVARDVRLGRRLRVMVTMKSSNVVRIGVGSVIGDDVRIELRGGSLLLGEGSDIRARCVLGIGGRMELEEGNVVQPGCGFHCDESILVRRLAGIGEYSTIVDSSHSHEGEHDWFGHNIRTAPIVIGEQAWLGAKVTVGRGVRIGDRCVIGANSVVVKDVPDGHFASGVPAQVLRPASAPAPRGRGRRSGDERSPAAEGVSSNSS